MMVWMGVWIKSLRPADPNKSNQIKNKFTVINQQLQIKSFIILAGLRRSVQRVGGAHLRVNAPGQHSSFRRNVAAVASRWHQSTT